MVHLSHNLFRKIPQKDCIFTGDGKNGVFADNPLKFKMVALRIVF
jgi:hypothetical protein